MVLTTSLLNDIRDNTKTRLEAVMTYSAVGDDNTPPTSGDTTLGNETFRSAIDDFDSSQTDRVTASLLILTTENNGNDIKETGWFDDPSSGTMYTHNTMTTITKTSDINVFLDTTIIITVEED